MFSKKKKAKIERYNAINANLTASMQKDITMYWAAESSDDAITLEERDGSKRCSKCGQKLADDAKVCPGCKRSLLGSMTIGSFNLCKRMMDESDLKPGDKPLLVPRKREEVEQDMPLLIRIMMKDIPFPTGFDVVKDETPDTESEETTEIVN